jgi:glycosyltransferase involved in cell wall biosynthesis
MQSQSFISVVICTHNPRPSYLARVVEALGAQSLPYEDWELLLIDNGSSEALANLVDLRWHPNARHIREDELGLTAARLRGIAESRGELLVFVDDDNVLAPNYLAEALRIEREWPMLGAWDGGHQGEFEVQPAAWTRPYLNYFLREACEAVMWSNNPDDWGCYLGGLACVSGGSWRSPTGRASFRILLGGRSTARDSLCCPTATPI